MPVACVLLTNYPQSQAIRNLEAILKEGGATLQDAIKVNVYLTNMDNFAEFNKVYEACFTGSPRPVSSFVLNYIALG